MNNKFPLLESYYVTEISVSEFQIFSAEHGSAIFQDLHSFDVADLFSEKEKRAKEKLEAKMGTPFSLYYGIFYNDALIGWSFGKQETSEKFYMVSSAILPEHQGKGIYGRLIPIILDRVKEEGFQIVYSRHRSTHNAVIIPKLKSGFSVTALELSEKYGSLIHLSYYFNETRKEMLEFRSGKRLPSEKIKAYLKL